MGGVVNLTVGNQRSPRPAFGFYAMKRRQNARSSGPRAPFSAIGTDSRWGPVLIPHVFNGRDKAFFFTESEAPRSASAPIPTYPRSQYAHGRLQRLLTQRKRAKPTQLGQPFPNNLIPASRIDPVARADYPTPRTRASQPFHVRVAGQSGLVKNAYPRDVNPGTGTRPSGVTASRTRRYPRRWFCLLRRTAAARHQSTNSINTGGVEPYLASNLIVSIQAAGT